MMETNYGSITNPRTGVEKNITVKTTPNSLKDILIGGGVILAGIAYMTVKAFKNGSMAYMEAENKALDDADLTIKGPCTVPYDAINEGGYIFTDKTKK